MSKIVPDTSQEITDNLWNAFLLYSGMPVMDDNEGAILYSAFEAVAEIAARITGDIASAQLAVGDDNLKGRDLALRAQRYGIREKQKAKAYRCYLEVRRGVFNTAYNLEIGTRFNVPSDGVSSSLVYRTTELVAYTSATIINLTTVTAGSNIVVASAGPFTANDVGKKVAIALGTVNDGLYTIIQYDSVTQIRLDANMRISGTATNSLLIIDTNEYVTVSAVCETPGEVGRISHGAVLDPVSNIPGFVACAASADAYGGWDVESDDALIERMRRAKDRTSAILYAYDNALMGLETDDGSSRIYNVYVEESWATHTHAIRIYDGSQVLAEEALGKSGSTFNNGVSVVGAAFTDGVDTPFLESQIGEYVYINHGEGAAGIYEVATYTTSNEIALSPAPTVVGSSVIYYMIGKRIGVGDTKLIKYFWLGDTPVKASSYTVWFYDSSIGLSAANPVQLVEGTEYWMNLGLGRVELATGLDTNQSLYVAYSHRTGIYNLAQKVINGESGNADRKGVRALGIHAYIDGPTAFSTVTVNVGISVKQNYTVADVQSRVQLRLVSFINSLGFIHEVYLNQLIREVMLVPGVANCEFYTPTADTTLGAGVIPVTTSNDIEVVEWTG